MFLFHLPTNYFSWVIVGQPTFKNLIEYQKSLFDESNSILLLAIHSNSRSRNGNGCMEPSPEKQVARGLPRLCHGIPGQNRGAVVKVWGCVASTDVKGLVDQGGLKPKRPNRCCWKLSAPHLPPLQLAATGIDGHLVVTSLASMFPTYGCQIENWVFAPRVWQTN